MSSLNPIQLQAQNIDLRQRLEEAEKRIHQLQIVATQQTIHVINESHQVNESLEALRRGSKTNTSPERQVIDNLRERCSQAEEKVSASMKLVESLRDENTRLRAGGAVGDGMFSGSSSGDMPPPPASPPETSLSNPLQPMMEEQQASLLQKEKDDLLKQLAALRTQVATSNADVFRWKSAHTALNNELTRMRADMQKLQSEHRSATTVAAAAGSSQAHIEQIKAINEELNDKLQGKCGELDSAHEELDKKRAELSQTQQMLVRATQKVGGDKSRVAALEAENAKLKTDLGEERAENKSMEREMEEMRKQIASMNETMETQKRVAAEAEFDRILEGTDEESRLKKVIAELEEKQARMAADLDKSQAEHGIMLKLKDKTLIQLSQTSEELIKAREHFQRREQELLAQIASLQQQQSTPPPSPTPDSKIQQQQQQQSAAASKAQAEEAAATQRQQLADSAQQQQRLQADRDSQARDRRKAELMAKLQERTREDKASAQVIFQKVSAAYDKLLHNLREAYKKDAATSQEFCYYELLWDYERQLFHLRNDFESMQTIVGIKQGDSDAELARVKNELENKAAILRFQIQDLGARPQC